MLPILAWVTAAGQPPAPVEPASKPAAPLGETKIVTGFVESKLNAKALAELYRKFTGRRVTVDPVAATAEFTFLYEASPEDPLTYAVAAELVRRSAGIEGFAFVSDTKDENHDVLTADKRRSHDTNIVYDESDPLPAIDLVIGYVMRFKHIKASEAAAIFKKRRDLPGADPRDSIAATNSAVVIVGKVSFIRALIEIKQEIDKPRARKIEATK
jgi:hypothetical protein